MTNDAQRLTALGSVRAQYWDEALQVYREDKLLGAGADGYATARRRYRRGILDVRHAHGYAVQTLADLGAVGLAVSLALLAAFLAAAGRTTGLWGPARRSAADARADRAADAAERRRRLRRPLARGLDVVRPRDGDARRCSARAGSPGRGPVLRAGRAPRRAACPTACAAARATAAARSWPPARSCWRSSPRGRRSSPSAPTPPPGRALDALAAGHTGEARRLATTADDQDPLAVDALFDLAVIETTAGRPAVARGVARPGRAPPAARTPTRGCAWPTSRSPGDPKAALRAVGAALYLDPRSPEGQPLFLQATRAQGQAPTPRRSRGPAGRPGAGAARSRNPAVTTDGTTTTPAP